MKKVALNRFCESCRTVKKLENLPANFEISGISIDTRTLHEGDLYIAIRGERFDGHDFAREALDKGASAVVAAAEKKLKGVKKSAGIIRVSDSVRFLMEFSGWYRAQFSIPVIAITGSTGKTTTKEMLASILGLVFRVIKTQKNMNNFIGVPLTLLQISDTTDVAVVEVGTNHPGEIATLTDIVLPTHAVITNIGSGHIGFFGSKEAIYAEKTTLFERMKFGTRIYINAEDILLEKYSNDDLSIKSCGLRKGLDYEGELLRMDERGRARFRINHGPEIQLQIPGRHQLLNALLAGSIALDMGISPSNVKLGLESVLPQDKRMVVEDYHDILLINDAYNSNPESLRAAIDYLCELPRPEGTRKYMILGDMLELGEKSEDEHRQIGHYLKDKPVDAVLCLGQYSRFIYEVIRDDSSAKSVAYFFERHEEAGKKLSELLQKGDILLLKGSRGMAVEKVLPYLETRG
ncbi:MAG: UDP-N-acetylmuramoyl-tripeptide--D-alanyl-D-alanine ligase [Calditrichaeota bacterium]|nr:UDP-N-acetylmuramoyl-tripeptide--D-alanyl-D-alanine ligase [Calditrichota bacterium]RQW05986.1 MAG: UDP-N-acetylmuramoyl-tripeptide--D-alanyl-D-alanine ligase [Calditrichota bacterium]